MGRLVPSVSQPILSAQFFFYPDTTIGNFVTVEKAEIYGYFSTTLMLVYDTLVILVISYRLATDSLTGITWSARLRSVIRGNGLLNLSRALMRSGQLYYM